MSDWLCVYHIDCGGVAFFMLRDQWRVGNPMVAEYMLQNGKHPNVGDLCLCQTCGELLILSGEHLTPEPLPNDYADA